MNITEVAIFLGLAGIILATQIGHRTLTTRRILFPLLVSIGVGYSYLKAIPTVGGDLDFEVICAAAGAALGLLAAFLMRVERDGVTGKIMTTAGVAYAAVWILAFGGRLAFGWGASNLWQQQVAQFSIEHQITGGAAWTAAFVLMAISMVLARTVVVGLRALALSGGSSVRMALR